MDLTLSTAAEREIVGLHRFFEGWLSGRLADDDDTFAPLARALSPDFTMVGPQGKRLDRAAVLNWLKAAHGSCGADFRIWIESVSLLMTRGGVVLASYDECQHMGGRDTRRRATGVFEEDSGARNGLVWLAVHETWVD